MTIGVPYELFRHLNPTKLKPFQIAFENQRKIKDEQMWIWWGTYGLSAFQTVMSHFGAGLAGKKSDAKYIETPIYNQIKNNKQITEEEKNKQIEQLFMQLQIMETNFKANQKDGSK